ncbi:benzoyl-CoA 2,3-epoxidase subunit BoxB [Gordonia humi]|uniref:benzoyl-CoA 2,3-epoxidase subunit BoxB n=1 Tax=Gordonia humi TaxID=686429 RepID=UPI003616942E
MDYSEKIPNNVDLASDRRLQRALEGWQPKFLDWWRNLGPAIPTKDVYLRTAVAVGRDGWAHFDHVPMEEYRWGIFLAEADPDKKINFGKHKGEPVWNEVPGEYRADLMRLIVVQGDTEPASVEQQRILGQTAPSIYDMRNLFQVNVEEGRHLWAMVYLLQAYFGREGREEAEKLLQRNSGDFDNPRILGAFNEETTDWLQFFMFTYFTDRDGKYQLGTLKESAFDPLARTCEFMLKEEAHHMFVGTTGVQRTVEKTAQKMKELGTDDADALFAAGVIPLSVIQKYLNFQFSVSMDLFGSEQSTNAGNYYSEGIKGRWQETRRKDDHILVDDERTMSYVEDGEIKEKTVSALGSLNLDLRNEYVADCANGVARWNQELEDAELEQRLTLPHEGFHRKVGTYAEFNVSPDGEVLDDAAWGGACRRVAAVEVRSRAGRRTDGPRVRVRRVRRLDRSAEDRHQLAARRIRLRPPRRRRSGVTAGRSNQPIRDSRRTQS